VSLLARIPTYSTLALVARARMRPDGLISKHNAQKPKLTYIVTRNMRHTLYPLVNDYTIKMNTQNTKILSLSAEQGILCLF